MSLKIVRITRDFPDMNALEQIAVEAFPPQEYVSPQDLLSYTESSDDCDFWGFYAGKDFIGYLHLIRYKNMVYVCFFAVGVSYRSCGYGSEILSRLKELYPAYQIVLDIEAADESAPNLAQRIRRRDFYRRNGYVPTGHYIAYWGMTFEILCSGGDFDLAVYKELVSNIRVEGISFRFFTKYFVSSEN